MQNLARTTRTRVRVPEDVIERGDTGLYLLLRASENSRYGSELHARLSWMHRWNELHHDECVEMARRRKEVEAFNHG